MPSKKKKYNARFPAGRIKKIMQTDEEVGKVAQAVPVIISRTLELFVESLLTKAMEITSAKNAKTLTPTHMKQCILSEQRFDFLKELVDSVQETTNGEDDTSAMMSSGLLTPPLPHINRSIPKRRKSSSRTVKEMEEEEEEEEEEEVVSVKEEEPVIKEQLYDASQVVANCSTLRLQPNFYAETMPEQRVSIHQPPILGEYQDRLCHSPVLVMDEDYDT